MTNTEKMVTPLYFMLHAQMKAFGPKDIQILKWKTFLGHLYIVTRSPGAKSQKVHHTRFRLLHQVANVSWFYLIEIPIEIII